METFTKLMWPIGWLWFTSLRFKPTIWAQSYSWKRTKRITPLQGSHPLFWNWAKLSLQSSLFYPPKFNVDKPTQRLGHSLWHLLKISHLTLKNSMTCVTKFFLQFWRRQLATYQCLKLLLTGVKRNFWPVIVSQLFCFSEQENKVWQLLFWCVLCNLKHFA